MDRRTFLKSAAIGSVVTGISATIASAERYFPINVDQSLFPVLTRSKTGLKRPPWKSHMHLL